ncbi:uncharacterized protein PHALS_06546 [Plasmopara halstedii]|uniref:Uncharacterized protein n=1 Tax=Plasmopara halstedii TaxID=4781 RepID=A0A0P1B4A2_PLAHL|nr:uncharacterized protein PHALS_06546 [Plasmopara halstedii]CEG48740.1 hypothetical protein PHALS_06546 [Plasmopara halstedii]|eukprot:XP_024585109.1 hypothetical protein PHALS_06546 [Plasmopara halstedii]
MVASLDSNGVDTCNGVLSLTKVNILIFPSVSSLSAANHSNDLRKRLDIHAGSYSN